MKKNVKKLTLSRETLRVLADEPLTVAGGANLSLQYSRCINNSCGIACTYNTACTVCPTGCGEPV